MKRTILPRLAALIAIIIMPNVTVAQSGTGWSFNSATGELTLSGAKVKWREIGDYSYSTKSVVFASDFSVTSIPDNTFKGFFSLEEIEIPACVTSLGDAVFYNCQGLKKVVLPANLTSIGEGTFDQCSLLWDVTLPTALESIGESAFSKCYSLQGIDLPEGLLTIGKEAFANCTALSAIVLPSSLERIGDGAFYNCATLKTVTLGYDDTADTHYIYLGTSDDTGDTGSDVFPDSGATLVFDADYTAIGYSASSNLRSYFKQFRGTGWAYDADSNTMTITSVDVDWSEIAVFASTTQRVRFSADVTVLPESAFESFDALVDIDIPGTVREIGASAFFSCTALTSLELPASVGRIGKWAFYDCLSLRSVKVMSEGTASSKHCIYLGEGDDRAATSEDVFPDHQATLLYDPDITWIGDDETQNIWSYFGDVVTSTADTYQGWTYDEASKTLTLSGSKVAWHEIANYATVAERVVFASDYDIAAIPTMAFVNFINLKEICVPDVVSTIGDKAFRGCQSLVDLTLPASVSSVGVEAFYGCSALETLTLPEGLVGIPDYAFFGCSSLADVTLPERLETIGKSAFQGCSSLDGVTLPATLTGLGQSAFSGCSSLGSVVIPSSVTSISQEAFYNCASLSEVSLPSTLVSVAEYAFAWCTSLVEVTIPDGVGSVGSSAFSWCTSLGEVALPDGLRSIESYTFCNCTSLEGITLPASLESIGESAFYNSGLKSIVLPASLTFIDNEAFSSCDGLSSVEILSNGTSSKKHIIYLADATDSTATGLDVFPYRQATLTYNHSTTNIGKDNTQNIRHYFKDFVMVTTSLSTPVGCAVAQYYGLDGRALDGPSHNALVIRRVGGQSSLVIAK